MEAAKKRKTFTLRNDVYKDENMAYKKKAHEEMQRTPYTTQRTRR